VELDGDAATTRRMIAGGTTTTVQGTRLDEPAGVSTCKALERPGLQLEPRRAPIDVLVIDSIMRTPTPDRHA
jgi:uncharacterized protein (TIGR03435 family)